jgi:hypothetical protein
MRLIGLAVLITLSLALALLEAGAQEAGRVHQIGLVTLGTDPMRSGFWKKFLEAMRELNYVEGRNLIVRSAFGEGNAARLSGLVADLVRAKVDVCLA